MDTKDRIQDDEIYIKILQNAFELFYGKDTVALSFMNEEPERKLTQDANSMIVEIRDDASKISRDIRCTFMYECPRLFVSFLLESFENELLTNNIGNFTTKDIRNLGKKIYRNACRYFEMYMRNSFYINSEDIIEVSASYYEGAGVDGYICFFLDTEDELLLNLDDHERSPKISFCGANVKKIRKMIEITNSSISEEPFELAFVFDGEWWLDGFTNCVSKDKHRIRICFIKHMVWDMYWDLERVVRYSCGRYINPETNCKDIFEKKIEKLIGDKSNDVWELVDAAIGQRHGTTLVIICEESKTVIEEVESLLEGSSGTLLSQEAGVDVLKPEYVSRLTAVDGALLIDHKGRGYGFGMIFAAPGDKRIKRDPGRGARFNSAKLYIADLAYRKNGEIKALAVIVSEDGMVDFYSTADAREEGAGNAD